MQKLSTGHDATLGNYRKMAVAFWGEASGAVKFLDAKITESPNGEAEEVLADETQMIQVLAARYRGILNDGNPDVLPRRTRPGQAVSRMWRAARRDMPCRL